MVWLAIGLAFVLFSIVGIMTGTVNSFESFLNALPLIGPVIEGRGLVNGFPEAFLVFSVTALISCAHTAVSPTGQFLERFITAGISAFIVAIIRMVAGEKVVMYLSAIVFIISGIISFFSPETLRRFWLTLFISMFAYAAVLLVIGAL